MRRSSARPLGVLASLCLLVSLGAASVGDDSPELAPAAATGAAQPHDQTTVKAISKARGEAARADVELPRAVRGAAAIRLLGDEIDEAAALNAMEAEELDSILRTDSTAWVDPDGRLFYKDAPAPAVADAPVPAPAAPLSETFNLHSKPGARLTIFLDFDGGSASGTAWHQTYPGVSTSQPAWHPAGGSGSSFPDAERAIFQAVWEAVVEDYAPFDVNVTTQDPGPAAIYRSSLSDQSYGARVLITPDTVSHNAMCLPGGCGGIAYIGAFDAWNTGAAGDGYGYYQPAWVFPQMATGTAKGVAEAASHEAGHQLGLNHDGVSTVSGDNYYAGHGAWGPIMGAVYSRPITHWSKGDYPNGNQRQDDVAIISSVLGLRADEAGGHVTTAAAFPSGTAYISSRSDVDYFLLGTCSGNVSIGANALASGANLDIKLSLVNASGSTIATADPASAQTSAFTASGMSATVNQSSLPSDTYYAVVDGVGSKTWATEGYDDYGSLGGYTMSKTGNCTGTLPADVPSAPRSATATPHATAASVALSWAAPSTGTVTGYVLTRSGDDTPVEVGAGTTSYTWTGLSPSTSYTFTITPLSAKGPGAKATVTASTNSGALLPSAPQLLTASWDSPRQVGVIGWQPPADTGNATISNYRFYVDGAPIGYVAGSARFADLTVNARTAITVGIAAVNAAGEGPIATVSLVVPPRPVNDAFSQPTTLPGVSGSVTGDNTEASAEAGEPAPSAIRTGAGGASVWYAWTAPAEGPVTISTTSSVNDRDTILNVHLGTDISNLFPVASNDDPSSGGRLASVTFNAYAGMTYLIAVNGYRGSPGGIGPFGLTWSGTGIGAKETATSLTTEATGRSVTVRATVTATVGKAAGYVQFVEDGTRVFGTGFVSSTTSTVTATRTDLPKGDHTYTAQFTPWDEALFTPSTSATRTVAIAATTTATTLQAAADQQTVTLSAAVTPTAGTTGIVEFREGATVVGSAAVTGGAATTVLTDVAPGPHSYTATLVPADTSRYDGSTSSTATVTVPPLPPAAGTSTSLTGAVDGRSATLTATVTAVGGGSPSGSVQFTDGDVVIGSAPLGAGTATLVVDDLTRGTHQFRATFIPTNPARFESSQSSVTPIEVAATATTTEITGSAVGRTVTLDVSVTPSAAGTVEVREGDTLVGTVVLSGGYGRLVLSDLGVGEHTYTATYVPADDLRHAPSTSAEHVVTVDRTTSATALGSSVSHHRVTLTATVTVGWGTAAGTVTFREGETVVGTAPVADGTASTTLAGVTTGQHVYTATFSPSDATSYAGSESAAHTATVVATPTATDLVVGVDGRTVTLDAAVTTADGELAGSVEFREGSTLRGTVDLEDGEAALELTEVAPGAHAYTATFVPEGTTHAGSTSGIRTAAVTVATETTLSTSVDGRAVTLAAEVTGPGAPAGSVQFRDGTSLVGTAPLAAGAASVTLENVAPGAHSYTATFVPSDTTAYAGSVSEALVVDVDRVSTTTGLAASVSERSVTLTATVTAGSGSLTGTVQFRDGATVVGTRTLSGGQASVTLGSVTHGAHSYTATFVPTGTVHNGSTSAAQSVTVLGSTTTSLATNVTGRTVTITATVGSDGTSPVGTVWFYRSGSFFNGAAVSNGTATVTLTNVQPGDYTYTATFRPTTAAHAESSSSVVTATVAKVASNTALQASASGRTVTLDATVTVAESAVSGQVQFRDGEAVVGTVNVNTSGTARLTLSDVEPGAHTYTATFVPSAPTFFAGSTSPERSVTVARVATATALVASATGRTVTLTATPTASAGTLTGSIEFREGEELLATRPLSGTSVVLELTGVLPGEHGYTATFVPTGTFHDGSTSPTRTATAAAYSTTTGLTATASGRTVSLDAEVVGAGSPVGEVVFRDGTAVVGTVALEDGAAGLTLPLVAPGEHRYTATFVSSQPGTYAGSASDAQTVVVDPIATATALDVTYAGGQDVTLTAQVTGANATPTGTVEFREGSTVVATRTLGAGSATATLRGVAPGEHTYTATYVPDDAVTYAASTSGAQTVDVDPIETRTDLTAEVEDDVVLLRAELDIADAAGRIVFREGSTIAGTVDLAGGSALLRITGVATGAHTYTATFEPADSATYAGSASFERTVIVKVPTATSLAGSVSGRTVTLTAAVTGAGAPAGEVIFREGDLVVGTAVVDGGIASLALDDVTPGQHSYRATFVPATPDTVAGSVSAPRTVTVDPIDTTTALTTAVDGRTVTLDAEVTGTSGSPAGEVVFREGDDVLATVDLESGAASTALAAVTPGEHAYTATFVPADPIAYAGSESPSESALVDAVATTTELDVSVDGRTVTLDIDVTSSYAIPAGEVVVRDGGSIVGTVVLADGTSSIELTDVDPGEHRYVAAYLPADPVTHAPSSSEARIVSVAAIATETDLVATVDMRTVSLEAEVTGASGTPAGEVVFHEGDDVVGTVVLEDGAASVELIGVDPGEHTYSATFVPTNAVRFEGSVSPERTVTVAPIVTESVLVATVDVRTVTLDAEVTGASGTPGGEVVFREGEDVVGTVVLEDGAASLELTGVEPGEHTYTATFVPTNAVRFEGSVSPERTVTVAPIVTETGLAVAVDVRAVTLDAEVAGAGGTPAGEVVFREGDDVVGTVELADGAARLELTGIAPGDHTYTATFVPTNAVRFGASVSPERTATVDPIVTTTDLTATAEGLDVTLEVRVTGESGSPAGEVVLREGDDVLDTLALDEGAATLRLDDLAPGDHTYSATFVPTDPTTYAGSESGDRVVNVGRIATTTVLEAEVDERTVRLTARVSSPIGTPTGAVTFYDGWGYQVDTVPVVDGRAAAVARSIHPGDHTFTAVFEPTGTTHRDSVGERAVSVSSDPVRTETTLELTADGRTVFLSGVVSSSEGHPAGSVEFWEGTELVTSWMVDGQGRFGWEIYTTRGPHAYTAVFRPDDTTNFASSTSPEREIEVPGILTETTLEAAVDGDRVTLTTRVSSLVGWPWGDVTLYDGDEELASYLTNDTVEHVITDVPGGVHTYRAVFRPTIDAFAISTAQVEATVAPTPTDTTLQLDRVGRSVTLTAAVTAPRGSPVGTVSFRDGLTVVANAPVEAGVATATLDGVATGDHAYTATFVPDNATRHLGSEATKSLAMTSSATSTELVVKSNRTTVTFTSTVSSPDGTPTGMVEIVEGDEVVARAELVDGVATVAVPDTLEGAHVYRATYLPTDDTFVGSESAERSITVTDVPPAATTMTGLTADAVRRTVTLTASVGSPGGAPVGAVQFLEDDVVVGSVPVLDGTARLIRPAVAAGRRSYTAQFVPANAAAFETSTSPERQLDIAPTVTTTAIEGSVSGSTVSLAVTVAGTDGIEPVGSVQLYDGGTPVGVVDVVSGRASLVVGGVPVGAHGYSARFLPATGDQAASESGTVTLTVAPPVVAPPVVQPPVVQPPVVEPPPAPAVVASKTMLTAPKSAKAKARPTVKVRVTRGSAPATGKVVLTVGKTKVALTLKAGAASYKLPKLKKGTLKLSVTYAGDATTKASSAKATIKVK